MASKLFNTAFTIVELLVVIIVISIVTAITIVAYSNTVQKSSISIIQSDLNGAAKQLEIYRNVTSSSNLYPADAATAALKSSGNNVLEYNVSAFYRGYCVSSTNGSSTYSISSYNRTIQPGDCSQNALQKYYDAANSSSYSGSGVNWLDLSGNNATGVLTSGPTYDSQNGGSILFDGIDDKIVPSKVTSLANTDFSIIFWAKCNGLSTNWPTIWTQYGDNTLQLSTCNGASPGQLIFWWASGAQNGAVYVGGLIPVNTWHQGGLIYDSSTKQLQFFYNGAIAGPVKTIGRGYYINNTSEYFGYYGAVQNFPGYISVIKIYTRALSVSEIQQNFNALRGRYGI